MKYLVLCFSLVIQTTDLMAVNIEVDGNDGNMVDDGLCSISEAIINANDDAVTYIDCSAGDGDDTIVVMNDVILDSEISNLTGTPAIDSIITIEGNGYVLQRNIVLPCTINEASDAGEFRILYTNSNSKLILKNISISNGCVDGSTAGGIYNTGELTLENTHLLNNIATSAGAIFNSGTIITIEDSSFTGNTATTIIGGAILNINVIYSILSSTFENNSAFQGGAIYNNSGDIVRVLNSTFSANNAVLGGAIYDRAVFGAILNSTFYGNSADAGGAIYGSVNSMYLKNTLFVSNSPDDCDVTNTSSTIGDNNISNLEPIYSGCSDLISSLLNPTSIGTLIDNGGLTKTHALLTGSQAIDKAIDGTLTDQRGLSPTTIRDLGAFEFNGIQLLFRDGFEN